MRRGRFLYYCGCVLWVLLGSMLFGAPSRAYACSCLAANTAMKALEGADVVFRGTVVGVTDVRDGATSMTPSGREYTFDVKTVWKGEVQSQYKVRTGFGGGDCGVSFELGESAVVFATMSGDQVLGTGSCSYWRPMGALPDEVALSTVPSTVVEDRGAELIELPEASVYSAEQGSGVSLVSVVPMAGVVALVVAGGMAAWNRRRPIR